MRAHDRVSGKITWKSLQLLLPRTFWDFADAADGRGLEDGRVDRSPDLYFDALVGRAIKLQSLEQFDQDMILDR